MADFLWFYQSQIQVCADFLQKVCQKDLPNVSGKTNVQHSQYAE
jgi:hypothetical protein